MLHRSYPTDATRERRYAPDRKAWYAWYRSSRQAYRLLGIVPNMQAFQPKEKKNVER